jgi:prepilin-type N-terminal cleavage/methylation domain-containing protein/prepilin-type processing-associated H-X9-DG protein
MLAPLVRRVSNGRPGSPNRVALLVGGSRCEAPMHTDRRPGKPWWWGARGFSLAELLVVIGVLALLFSIMIPPLRLAHRDAKRTYCAANLQRIGVAIGAAQAQTETDFFPLWDDGGSPTRYTWVDVLVQLGMLTSPKGGYCPEDARPDPLNRARGEFFGLIYPGGNGAPGIDYSYAIGVPLSAGGWLWSYSFPGADARPHLFVNKDENVSSRVLAADGVWSCFYNLSGDAITTGIWNEPSQSDNMIAWQRHPGFGANLLMQDFHVESVRYRLGAERPVDTQRYFAWYPNEPLHVGPGSEYMGNYYPNVPPLNLHHFSPFDAFAAELVPGFYTEYGLWTHIQHK